MMGFIAGILIWAMMRKERKPWSKTITYLDRVEYVDYQWEPIKHYKTLTVSRP